MNSRLFYSLLFAIITSTFLLAQTLKITSPKVGESWVIEEIYDISWEADNISGKIVIEYKDGYDSKWKPLKDVLVEEGIVSFYVQIIEDNYLYIRIKSMERPSISDEMRIKILDRSSEPENYNPPKITQAKSQKQKPIDILQIDIEQSRIEWIGRKVTGEHSGTIDLIEGWVQMDGNTLVAGRLIFDMTSITNTDIESPDWRDKLEAHLKSQDFFYVSSFPQALLEIKRDKSIINNNDLNLNNQVGADLTIRNITHEISFPYKLDKSNSNFTAIGSVDIDRTLYNIEYKSGKFFSDLGDKLIYDDFTIKFEVRTFDTQIQNESILKFGNLKYLSLLGMDYKNKSFTIDEFTFMIENYYSGFNGHYYEYIDLDNDGRNELCFHLETDIDHGYSIWLIIFKYIGKNYYKPVEEFRDRLNKLTGDIQISNHGTCGSYFHTGCAGGPDLYQYKIKSMLDIDLPSRSISVRYDHGKFYSNIIADKIDIKNHKNDIIKILNYLKERGIPDKNDETDLKRDDGTRALYLYLLESLFSISYDSKDYTTNGGAGKKEVRTVYEKYYSATDKDLIWKEMENGKYFQLKYPVQ